MQPIKTSAFLIAAGALTVSMTSTVLAADAKLNGHKIATKARLIHFDRDFENDSSDREQTALGVELNYTSPQFGDIVGIGVSGYLVEDLDDDGATREDILTLDDGELDGFSLIGQAYINLTPTKNSVIKIGRQKHKSIFLSSSGSRAVPNTFRGINAVFKPIKGLSIYGTMYDEWSRRARDDFEGFATDRSEEGDIDYVGIIGAKYKVGSYTIEGEYLTSKDYLSKLGVRGSYKHKLAASSVKFTGGIFTSSDDGDLFVTAAESGDLDDENEEGAVSGVTSSSNDGLGAYIEAAWTKGGATISLALAKIDEIWIEDNFTGDHGTNPFPTRSAIGPDFTNSNETVAKLKATYDWKGTVQGLKTSIAFAKGRDAENSADASLGSADESYRELDIRYKIPSLKGLSFRGLYHDYTSDETGAVDGVKGDDRDIRLYLDYRYAFK
ncbi:MAG: OprD family outer membrane porin [Candidatus Thiodiazotropha sp.]